MKNLKFLTIVLALLFVNQLDGQYLEPFSSVNKGILQGPCGATAMTCANFDFDDVNWFVNGDLSGIDSGDFVSTDGSDLSFEDVDEETCWESPILDISAVAGTFSLSVDVTYTGFDSEDYIDVEYQIDGGAWNQIPNMVGGGAGTIQFNVSNQTGSTNISQSGLSGTSTVSIRVCADFNLFGTFENASIDNVSVPEAGAVVLPVKWAHFDANSTEKGNLLEWSTSSEVNNEGFEIERSIDGFADFKKIGFVEGEGTSTTENHYEFLDFDQLGEVSYYRLKQIDFDGEYEYSHIVVVHNRDRGKINFAPNPFSTEIVLTSKSIDAIEGSMLKLFNSQGQIVFQREVTEHNMYNTIETSHLSSGMYFVQFGNGEMTRLVKL